MALICKYGTKECSFCGGCFDDREAESEIQCAVCGRLTKADKARSSGAFIALCSSCYKAVKYGGM